MRKTLVQLGAAIAVALTAGCTTFRALTEPPQRIECTPDAALPANVQKLQCEVLNQRKNLAAWRLTVDDRESSGLMTKARAAKLRGQIVKARDALDKVDEAIELKNFAEALSQARVEEAAINLLERELAEEIARQEAAK